MKILKNLFALLIIALTPLYFVSCGGSADSEGIAKIVVERGADDCAVYEVDLSKLEDRNSGAVSLLEYLSKTEKNRFSYTTSGGDYGEYIISIDLISVKTDNEYIAIYTNNSKDFAVPSEWTPTVPTVEYDSKTLTYSGVGLHSMNITDGTVILFRVESFE